MRALALSEKKQGPFPFFLLSALLGCLSSFAKILCWREEREGVLGLAGAELIFFMVACMLAACQG